MQHENKSGSEKDGKQTITKTNNSRNSRGLLRNHRDAKHPVFHLFSLADLGDAVDIGARHGVVHVRAARGHKQHQQRRRTLGHL